MAPDSVVQRLIMPDLKAPTAITQILVVLTNTNTNFTNAQNLTTQQVKAASNWNKAEYSPEFLQAIINSKELID